MIKLTFAFLLIFYQIIHSINSLRLKTSQSTDSIAIKANSLNKTIGPYLVDNRDMAIYALINDTNCTEECMSSFKPVLYTGNKTVESGESIERPLLGRLIRQDKSVQLTYNKHPLFYFIDDEVNNPKGVGLNQAWYLISPEGNLLIKDKKIIRGNVRSIRNILDIYNHSYVNLSSLNETLLSLRPLNDSFYLTSQSGMALYAFLGDSKNTSNCNGSCSTEWIPFTTVNYNLNTSDERIDSSLIDFLTRRDGRIHVMFNGYPLYFYSKERRVNETKGQGLKSNGDYWYLVDYKGELIKSNITSDDTTKIEIKQTGSSQIMINPDIYLIEMKISVASESLAKLNKRLIKVLNLIDRHLSSQSQPSIDFSDFSNLGSKIKRKGRMFVVKQLLRLPIKKLEEGDALINIINELSERMEEKHAKLEFDIVLGFSQEAIDSIIPEVQSLALLDAIKNVQHLSEFLDFTLDENPIEDIEFDLSDLDRFKGMYNPKGWTLINFTTDDINKIAKIKATVVFNVRIN